MFRSFLLLSGAAVVTACSGGTTEPRPQPSPGPSVQLVQLYGVLEMMDEGRLAIRQGDRLVPLQCAATEELVNAVGEEILVFGVYNEDGSFAVSRYELQPDGWDLFARARTRPRS